MIKHNLAQRDSTQDEPAALLTSTSSLTLGATHRHGKMQSSIGILGLPLEMLRQIFSTFSHINVTAGDNLEEDWVWSSLWDGYNTTDAISKIPFIAAGVRGIHVMLNYLPKKNLPSTWSYLPGIE
jgi:hypothetical protein